MIYIIFSDRLGNNLFQFAAAISLSNKVTICVPLKEDYQNTILYKDTFFKGFQIIDFIPKDIPIYNEQSFNFNKIPYIEGFDIILKGYFQSYKYINKLIAINQFTIDDVNKSMIKIKYPNIFNESFTSIHVRRGDYMNVLYKHPFCGLKYYNRAIDFIGRDKNYIILSDDINWCLKYLKLKNAIYVNDSSPVIDLYIQTYCKNNIISNSSFSWWGAYLNLNHGIVIAPKMWFGFASNLNVNDLLPPNYFLINNKYSFFLFIKAMIQFITNHILYKYIKLKKILFNVLF